MISLVGGGGAKLVSNICICSTLLLGNCPSTVLSSNVSLEKAFSSGTVARSVQKAIMLIGLAET